MLLIQTVELRAQDSTQARQWLGQAIDQYFESNTDFSQITTERYNEYKQDALNMGLDVPNALTQEQFDEKWGQFYDTSYAGIGRSFLIGQQDYGKVVMEKCELNARSTSDKFIFDTIISDTGFKLTYQIEIIVVNTTAGYRIDDVRNETTREFSVSIDPPKTAYQRFEFGMDTLTQATQDSLFVNAELIFPCPFSLERWAI